MKNVPGNFGKLSGKLFSKKYKSLKKESEFYICITFLIAHFSNSCDSIK